MSRIRHNELEWHQHVQAEKSYAARDLERIRRNTAIACDHVAVLLAPRRAARVEQKTQSKFNSILNLVLMGAALITLFSAGGVGRAFAMVMGS